MQWYPQWAPSALGTLLCSYAPDSSFPPSDPAPPFFLSQPRSPHAGLLTTGRSAPFPPPAHHTFGPTAEGTSTHLGTAEDRSGEEQQGWVTPRDPSPRGEKKQGEKGKPGDGRSWGNGALSMGWTIARAGPGEAGPETVAENNTNGGKVLEPQVLRVVFKLLYKNVGLPSCCLSRKP